MKTPFYSPLSYALSLLLLLTPVSLLSDNNPVDFATEVYPFLKANCLSCHNSTKAKADLILESPQAMLKGGDSGPAVVPGDADYSLLYTTAAHTEEPVMPPPNNKSKAKNLTPAQLATLKRWINEGAKGESVSTPAPDLWTELTGPQPIYTSAITNDGRFAAVGRGQKVDLYDLRLSKLITSLADPDHPFPTAHRDLVQALAFSADGTLASGGFRIAKIWKRSPLKSLNPTKLTTDPVCFSLSRKDNSMAIGLKDGSIALISLKADGDFTPVTFKDHTAQVNDISFSRDAKWLYSVSADNKINRRSLTEIDQSTSVSIPANAGNTLALVNGGKQILLGGRDQMLRLYPADLKTPKLFEYKNQASPIVSVKAVNSEVLVAYENGTVVHLKLDPNAPEKPPTEIRKISHGSPINQFQLSGSRIATAGPTGSVNLWNLSDGKKIAELKGNPNTPAKKGSIGREIAVAKRKKVYWDRKAPESEKLWKAESEKAKKSGESIAKARRNILEKKSALLSTGKDSDIATATEELKRANQALTTALRNRDASSRLAGDALTQQSLAQANALEAETLAAALQTDIETLAKSDSEATKTFAVSGLAFSPDGTMLALGLKEGGTRLVSANDGQWLEDLPTVSSTAKIGFVANDRLFVTDKDRKLSQWALPGEQWQLIKTLGNGKEAEPFSDRVSALAFDPVGARLLTGSGVPSRSGEITLWDTGNWEKLNTNPKAHDDSITSFAFSPDGEQFVSGSTDQLAKTFKTISLEKLKTFEGHTSHVLDVDWNADGLTLASCGADLQVKIWDITTVKEKSKVEGYKKEIATVAFVADSETLLTASGDKTLKLANQPLAGSGTTFLHTAAASADGKVIIAAGQDSTLRVWDGTAKKLLKEFASPEADSNRIASE